MQKRRKVKIDRRLNEKCCEKPKPSVILYEKLNANQKGDVEHLFRVTKTNLDFLRVINLKSAEAISIPFLVIVIFSLSKHFKIR